MSSMHDVVAAAGALAEQLDRSRDRASAIVAQVDQVRIASIDLGAEGLNEDLAEIRARARTVEMLLVQAGRNSDALHRASEAVRGGEVQAPSAKYRWPVPAPAEPADALRQVVFGPWRRERRWRGVVVVVPLVIPAAYLLGLFVPVSRPVHSALSLAVLAATVVWWWDRNRVRRWRVAWRMGARPQWEPHHSVHRDGPTLARRALRGGVEGDEETWREAIEQLYSSDEAVLREALDYVLTIDAMAFFIDHEQQWPDRVQMWHIAMRHGQAHPGSGADIPNVVRVLNTLVDRRTVTDLPDLAALLIPALTLGVWLMSSTVLPEPMRWRDFLREIEGALAERA